MALRLLSIPFAVLILLISSCSTTREAVQTVDPEATPQTQALFANLKALAPEATLFGHEDDLAYGVTWRGEPGRSDVKETAGSYPAVYGWDVGHLEHAGAEANLDDVRFDDMRRWMREAYARGGVNTISWHADNPVSGGGSWDTTRAVVHILPGGPHHETFVQWLDRFADYVETLRADDGTLIPIIFRPYHEMTGSWFWWGGDNVTPEEYRELWRFTADYLREERGLHNLLYAYSTDRFDTEADYLRYYPGDAYVDILGFDDYHSIRTAELRAELVDRMHTVVRQAMERGKVAAFTETGYETIPDSTWWTGVLLPALDHDELTRRLSYVLVWRNANRETDRPDHYYAPYPGHPSAEDFRRFREHELIVFEDDVPDLYDTTVLQ